MAWQVERVESMQYKTAQEQRLHDLALAMIIPWRDGWPAYYMTEQNEKQRFDEIREATKGERLPWQIL